MSAARIVAVVAFAGAASAITHVHSNINMKRIQDKPKQSPCIVAGWTKDFDPQWLVEKMEAEKKQGKEVPDWMRKKRTEIRQWATCEVAEAAKSGETVQDWVRDEANFLKEWKRQQEKKKANEDKAKAQEKAEEAVWMAQAHGLNTGKDVEYEEDPVTGAQIPKHRSWTGQKVDVGPPMTPKKEKQKETPPRPAHQTVDIITPDSKVGSISALVNEEKISANDLLRPDGAEDFASKAVDKAVKVASRKLKKWTGKKGASSQGEAEQPVARASQANRDGWIPLAVGSLGGAVDAGIKVLPCDHEPCDEVVHTWRPHDCYDPDCSTPCDHDCGGPYDPDKPLNISISEGTNRWNNKTNTTDGDGSGTISVDILIPPNPISVKVNMSAFKYQDGGCGPNGCHDDNHDHDEDAPIIFETKPVTVDWKDSLKITRERKAKIKEALHNAVGKVKEGAEDGAGGASETVVNAGRWTLEKIQDAVKTAKKWTHPYDGRPDPDYVEVLKPLKDKSGPKKYGFDTITAYGEIPNLNHVR